MNDTDLQLLQRYAQNNSQDSFVALVKRHLNLVFSAALRQVRSPQLAEEVAQSVFSDLARSATKLDSETILPAWLYEVTRRTAIDVVRRESRRQLREKVAHELTAMNATADDWTEIEPFLDEAMHALDATDRAAVLLRYFENKSLREVGETLGTSDDAAQKRVGRAVERLREFFTKRGVTVGASGLVMVISANAVQAAPVGMAAIISTAGMLAGTTVVAATTTATVTKTIAMTTFQKSVITATLAVAAGTGIYQTRQVSELRTQNRKLHQQQASLVEQIQQLQLEKNETANRSSGRADDIEKSKSHTELLKLRGEIGRLRGIESQVNDPFVQKALSWKVKETKLRELFENQPDQRVPEMVLLDENQWLAIARDADLSSEIGIRKALSETRKTAKNNFMPELRTALDKYVKANGGLLPEDLAQLQPYFAKPVAEEILEQYKLLHTGKYQDVPRGEWVISDKGVIDEEFDIPWQVGPNGYGRQSPSSPEMVRWMKELGPAVQAYSDAHNGKTPADISELKPYATTAAQRTALQKLTKQGVSFGHGPKVK